MKSKLFIFLLLLLTLGVYWQFFLPGPRVAVDFPLVSKSQLLSGLDWPRVWSENGAEGIGEYSAFFLWSWPLNIISGFLSRFNITFAVLEKVFFLIPILLIGAFGIFKFTQDLKLSGPVKAILALFYLTNTYLALLVDGGQLSIGLAYAFSPISFLIAEKSLSGGLRPKVLAGLTTAILGFLDIRFIYILAFLILLRFFYEFLFLKKEKWGWWIVSFLKSSLFIIVFVVGLNAYWLLPLLRAPILAETYSSFTQFSALNINLGHPFFLISPHWYKNIFGMISPLRWEFVLIPILAFLAPVLQRKNVKVGYWLLVSLISSFLIKGDAEPFSNAYFFLFEKIPYFSLFRDSTKFFVPLILAYTVLIGFSLDEIFKRIKFIKGRYILFLLIFLYLLFLIRPVYLGEMTGTFSQSPYQKEYESLGKIIEADQAYGRVFWMPFFTPLGYSSQNHPRVEASRLSQKRTFAVGTKGTYETFNFLREAAYMGEIFDVAGIGYIVYPPLDPRRDDMHPDNIKYYYTFLDQLSKRLWLTKLDDSSIPLLKTSNHQDRFFITPNTWWIIGSDDIYSEATKSANLKLAKNALIFAEEKPGLGQRIDELPDVKILLNHKTILDLAAGFINSKDLIFPARKLNYQPDKSGWWKREAADLIAWRSFLQEKYGIDNQDFDLGGGWAVGERSVKLKVKSEKFKKDQILLARVMEGSRSGSLKFYQGDQEIGEVMTKTDGDTNVRWFEVGQLGEGSGLVIKSEGDINVVNALAFLDKSLWLSYLSKADNLKDKIVDFNEKNAQDFQAEVSYIKINPTKYKVKVSNLTNPSLLVFSQNYDSFWKISKACCSAMNGQSPLPLYSLLNGFKIEKDGEYIVEFEPQKYVYPGLAVSIVSLMLLMLLLIKSKAKR